MNVYNITWVDHGNVVARNIVTEDVRPTQVEADSYEFFMTASDNMPYGIAFFKNDHSEAILFIMDLPLMIQRVGS